MQEIIQMISADDITIHEYSDTLTYRIIEQITILSKEEIRIRFVGGYEITQSLLNKAGTEKGWQIILPVFLCTCFSR